MTDSNRDVVADLRAAYIREYELYKSAGEESRAADVADALAKLGVDTPEPVDPDLGAWLAAEKEYAEQVEAWLTAEREHEAAQAQPPVEDAAAAQELETAVEAPKRGRGRPRKSDSE